MEKINVTKKDIVESPKDVILEAVVIEANKTSWAEIISPDKLSKFEEPEKEIVQVKFEALLDGKIFKGEDTFAYYDTPMSNSKMGIYLNKYESFDSGVKIKVKYNSQGFGSIYLE